MRASSLAAVATMAVAVALLLAAGTSAPRAETKPAHPPTHYSAAFGGLFPARDVWGQYQRSN
jgi:hypothetical protein